MSDGQEDGRVSYKEQDLGEMTETIRVGTMDEPHPIDRGVERLYPDDNSSHMDIQRAFRSLIDEHYSEQLERIAGDGRQVIIRRVDFRADDVPIMEYDVVNEK